MHCYDQSRVRACIGIPPFCAYVPVVILVVNMCVYLGTCHVWIGVCVFMRQKSLDIHAICVNPSYSYYLLQLLSASNILQLYSTQLHSSYFTLTANVSLVESDPQT